MVLLWSRMLRQWGCLCNDEVGPCCATAFNTMRKRSFARTWNTESVWMVFVPRCEWQKDKYVAEMQVKMTYQPNKNIAWWWPNTPIPSIHMGSKLWDTDTHLSHPTPISPALQNREGWKLVFHLKPERWPDPPLKKCALLMFFWLLGVA